MRTSAAADGATRFEQLNRYVSGELSDAEARRFEEDWIRDPGMTRELELDARMQAGLGELRDSGRLQAAMRGPWWTQSLRGLALAASVAAVGVAMWLWQSAAIGTLVPISASPTSTLGDSVVVMRLRSSRDDLATIVLPDGARAIELRVMPDVRPGPQASVYDLLLLPAPLDADGVEPPARYAIEGVPLGRDGFLRVYVESRQLEVGRYRLLVRPSGDPVADEFVIDVQVGADDALPPS